MTNRWPTFCSAFFILWCLALSQFQAGAANANHFVFAHYMVCYAGYGQSIEGYTQEILAAKAAGLDGFALNVGAWKDSGPDWYYKARVKLLYEAAEKTAPDFKLFFSMDMTNMTDIMDMVRTYAPRTNTFRFQGKTVVSTYGAMDADWKAIRAQLSSEGIGVFFVPYFWGGTNTWTMSLENGQKTTIKEYKDTLDGYYLFATRLPKNIVTLNTASSQACKDAGKLFMAGYSPHYWGFCQPYDGRPYFESQGGEGTEMQWTNIIDLKPDWVEITTWNDVIESTYLLPQREAELLGNFPNTTPPLGRYFHGAYLELSKYYIQWYKTGVQPAIDRDALFAFYRTQPTNAISSMTNDLPVTSFNGDVKDEIFITVMLRLPSSLEVSSGGTLTTNSLSPGLHHVRTSSNPGPQTFIIRRNGRAVVTVQGREIEGQNVRQYNFFPATEYGYGMPPGAPNGLRVLE